jgi:hypothetical protein
MHLELPQGKIQSLKAFGGHYLMIVVSILTALALEEWISHVHRGEAGRHAEEQIEAEIHENLAQVRQSIAENVERRKPLDALADSIVAGLKAGQPDAKIRAEVIGPTPRIAIGISWPHLRHEAWDVAVANQSAADIDPATLKRISSVYSAQKELTSGLQSATVVLLNGGRLIDVMTDLDIGDVSPRELAHSLRQMSATIGASQSDLKEFESQLAAAAGGAEATRSGTAAAARASN